jgi:hypothetical protein
VRTESVANDTSTLPDDVDADDEFDDELDLENLRVNFSTEEASSEGRDSFEALPSGRYPVVIFDGETRRVKDNAKGNKGKPFWNLQFAVTEDMEWCTNRRFFGSVMLFKGALYSLSQLMKALGEDIDAGDFKVPPIDDLFGQEIEISVQKVKDTYKMDRDGIPANEPIYKNEVKGYFPKGSGGPAKWAKEPKKGGSSRSAGSISSGGESLLPG